jgi:hypothetical protein
MCIGEAQSAQHFLTGDVRKKMKQPKPLARESIAMVEAVR